MVSAESQAAMDAAKKAVTEFMSKNGRHDTTVHEIVAPAIRHETISRKELEELVTLVNREITQDHYHTSVQPITDSETLEEQHHHNLLPVEDRTVEHDDFESVAERLSTEKAKFKDEKRQTEVEHTQTVVPMVAAEHIHHHVHELIIPVINKHTIEPHVIHTTVQIHERVHNASKHHTMSALPIVTMEEFKKQGGILVGREERWDSFEGEPRSVGGNVGTSSTYPTPGVSNDNAQHSAPSAPERRSSLPPQQRRGSVGPADKPAASSTDKPLPTPTIAGPTDTSKASEPNRSGQPSSSQPNQSQPTQAQPTQVQSSQVQPSQGQPSQGQPSISQPTPGRFSFLPMNIARSAGDAQLGHQPIRAPLRATTPGPADARQASVAKPGEQKQGGQDQQGPRRPS